MALNLLPVGGSLTLQIAVAIGAFTVLAFFPPSNGRMIIVSLGAADRDAALNTALLHGARLVGPGPLWGTFVIEGVRARLSGPLARKGTIVIAAPPAGCGQEIAA